MIKNFGRLGELFIWSNILLLFCGSFTGCSHKGGTGAEEIVPSPKSPKDGVFEKRGENDFIYTKYAPLAHKPVTVFYYIPTTGNVSGMPVLFSFHGSDGDATLQRNAWQHFAEANGFVVIAPQFSSDYYSENEYQFGGVYTTRTSHTLNPKEIWTYTIVEVLFDYFKAETGNTSATYNMFGHSAGGQFVHRYLMAMPNARVNRAVAANPSTWVFPYVNGIVGTNDQIYGWPYSIRNTPFTTPASLKAFFSKRLYVQLGLLDNDPNSSGLSKNEAAMAQGEYRLERGRFFFEECKRIAQQYDMAFFLQKAEVPNGNHSTLRMVYGRAVPNRADIANTGENCAFDLIFK